MFSPSSLSHSPLLRGVAFTPLTFLLFACVRKFLLPTGITSSASPPLSENSFFLFQLGFPAPVRVSLASDRGAFFDLPVIFEGFFFLSLLSTPPFLRLYARVMAFVTPFLPRSSSLLFTDSLHAAGMAAGDLDVEMIKRQKGREGRG